MTYDVYTPTRSFRIQDSLAFRTYTAPEMKSLLDRITDLEIAETYNFAYEINRPISIDSSTEDVVYVLRKT